MHSGGKRSQKWNGILKRKQHRVREGELGKRGNFNFFREKATSTLSYIPHRDNTPIKVIMSFTQGRR